MNFLDVGLTLSSFKAVKANINLFQGTSLEMDGVQKQNLSMLVHTLNINEVQGVLNREISSVVYDSRKAEVGSLFIAIRGFKQNGTMFINDAIARGASAFITETSIKGLSNLCMDKDRVTAIHTDDCRIALASVGSAFYHQPSDEIDLYGVTGTNGKTTVTYILDAIHQAQKEQSGIIGTIHYSYGNTDLASSVTTPESLDINRMLYEMTKQKIKRCFLEISSHSLILKRVHGMRFSVGIFTNLSRDHLDFHSTMDNYKEAKKGLFRDNFVEKIVTNIDDSTGREIANEFPGDLLTTGIVNSADVMAENCRLDETGSFFTMKTPFGSCEVKTNLLGKHNIYNLMSAASAALIRGVSIDQINQGLRTIKNIPGRFEKINCNRGFSVVVDYAHTDDALRNVLRSAQAFTSGRIITVFGCGGNRDKGKRKAMGLAATEGSGLTIITSDNPREEDPQSILDAILKGVPSRLKQGKDYIAIIDRKEAIRFAIHQARPGDLIIIAGKGHENYQILKTETIDFDDRKVASEIIRSMH